MASFTALSTRVAALVAGTQPSAPASDPVVLTSVFNTGIANKADKSDLTGLSQSTSTAIANANQAISGKLDSTGSASGLTITQTNESGALAIPLIRKNRAWAFFGDRKSITGNGTSDDTANAQNEITYAGANGIQLLIPDGMVIGTTSTLSATGWTRIRGRGGQLQKNNGNPNVLGSYTGFAFNHNEIGLLCASADVNTFDRADLQDFLIVRSQPPGVAGNTWTPAPANFDIDLMSTSGTVIGVECLRSTNFLRIRGGYGKVIVDRLFGQVFNTGVQVLAAMDNVYINQVHFWPFWTGGVQYPDALPILQYQLANHSGVHILRADGLTIGDVFTFAARQSVLIDYTSAGGDIYSAGTCGNGTFRKIYNDNGAAAIVATSAATNFMLRGAVVESYGAPPVAPGPNSTTLPYYTANNSSIDVAATNGNLQIGQYWSNNARVSHAVARGAGSVIDIAQFLEGSWNGSGTSAAGLVGSNGGSVLVGSWRKADATTASYTSFPTTGTRASGSVRGVLSRGITTITTNASGAAFWPHNAGQVPNFARVRIISPGTGAAVSSVIGGMDGTNVSHTFYTSAGVPVASKNDIIVEWETVAGF
jgi:hypothetical protein